MSILQTITKALSPIWGGKGRTGVHTISESFSGAWQRNISAEAEDVLTYSAVFSCLTLISNDISKMPLRIVKQDEHGIWNPIDSPVFSGPLKRPNAFQNHIEFISNVVISLLSDGNAYILLRKNGRSTVKETYLLSPSKVRPMVSDETASVFYQVEPDNLVGLSEPLLIPASEMIHLKINTLYHPLVGISPIAACSLPVVQGREIQKASIQFFSNQSRPSGILVAPGALEESSLEALRKHWADFYSGTKNSGRVAVLADGLSFQQLDAIDAQSSQATEQLNWSAEVVCSAFHVPTYMVLGEQPRYDNTENLQIQYYSQALQYLVENIELGFDIGLNLPAGYRTEFDLSALWRMDSLKRAETDVMLTQAGVLSPNEARFRHNMPPVEGGSTPFLQQQMWPVSILANRRDMPDDTLESRTVNRYFKSLNKIRNLEHAGE